MHDDAPDALGDARQELLEVERRDERVRDLEHEVRAIAVAREVVTKPLDLAVRHRVLDGDADLTGHRLEEVGVVAAERRLAHVASVIAPSGRPCPRMGNGKQPERSPRSIPARICGAKNSSPSRRSRTTVRPARKAMPDSVPSSGMTSPFSKMRRPGSRSNDCTRSVADVVVPDRDVRHLVRHDALEHARDAHEQLVEVERRDENVRDLEQEAGAVATVGAPCACFVWRHRAPWGYASFTLGGRRKASGPATAARCGIWHRTPYTASGTRRAGHRPGNPVVRRRPDDRTA